MLKEEVGVSLHVVKEELGLSLLKEGVSVSLHMVREELGVSLLKEEGVSLHVLGEEVVVLQLVVYDVSSLDEEL